jgi:nucleotide-binding universal stress UspA family protein
MKTIVAPTDFSEISLNAVNYAAQLARAINADLCLLNICVLPVTYSEVPYPIENMGSLTSDSEERMVQLKEDLTRRTNGKIKIHTDVKTATTVVGELSDYCKSKEPYAVVMGTQGRSAIEKIFFGSTAVNAMKHLPWPLVVVPPEARFTEIKKIGLACDLKKVDETIPFSEIRSLVKQFDAELYVLHINSRDEEKFGTVEMIEARSLQNMLEDIHPVYRFLENDDIENGLEEFAETHQIDLLLVVPKRHNIIDKLFHQSNSKKMVLHTHVPLMAIHE